MNVEIGDEAAVYSQKRNTYIGFSLQCGTLTLFVVPVRHDRWRNRFLVSLNVYKFGLWRKHTVYCPSKGEIEINFNIGPLPVYCHRQYRQGFVCDKEIDS
jgi:hypothetical protein